MAENQQSHDSDVARLLAENHQEAEMNEAFRASLLDRTRRMVASRRRIRLRRWALRLAAGAAAVAAGIALWHALGTPKEPLVAVIAARPPAADGAGKALRVGDRLRAGATVRTGKGGRVSLVTRRGSEFTLNEKSELSLGRRGRTARLHRGEIYCRSREREFSRIDTAAGRIHLLGTVLDARTQNHGAVAVTVVRGKVRLANAHGQAVVPAGKQALLVASRAPGSGKAVNTTAATSWYDGRGTVVSDFGEIAYRVTRESSPVTEVWAMDADGGNKHRLKAYVSRPYRLGPWVPGQQWLVLTTWGTYGGLPELEGRKARFCGPAGVTHVGQRHWLLDAATGQDMPFELPPGYDASRLLISPDATRIAFYGTYRPDPENVENVETGTWVYDVETGQIKKVLGWTSAGGWAWAPDSRHMAVSIYGKDRRYCELLVVDVDTGQVRDLGVQATGPTFSPDGTRLAYTYQGYYREKDPLRGAIYVVDLGSEGRPLQLFPPPPPNHTAGVRWSPDGARILYCIARLSSGGEYHPRCTLAVASADGSSISEIYTHEGPLAALSWAPSGEALYAVDSEKGVLRIAADGSGAIMRLGGTDEDSHLSGETRAQTEAAVAAIRNAFAKRQLGGLRAYQGRLTESREAFTAAAETFAGLLWNYPLANLSAEDVLAYADGSARMANRPAKQVLAQACHDRMGRLAHVLLWYGSEHRRLPADLPALQEWWVARGGNREWSLGKGEDPGMIFRCPSGDQHGPAVPYVYGPKAATGKLLIGDVIVSCPNHPEYNIVWDDDFFLTLGEVAGGGRGLLGKFGSFAPREEKGYRIVRQFAVVGPFPLDLKEDDSEAIPAGFLRAYPPEKRVDLQAVYQGMSGPVRWQAARAKWDGVVNLKQYVSPSDNAVAYATAVIVAPEQMDTTLALGSNDGAKVWVNGALLFSKHVPRRLPNRDLLPITLRPGRNRVLIKVENWGGDWEAYLSVRDPQNRLTFTVE